jgi:hypothetical protein
MMLKCVQRDFTPVARYMGPIFSSYLQPRGPFLGKIEGVKE